MREYFQHLRILFLELNLIYKTIKEIKMKKILFILVFICLGVFYSCSEDWLDTKPKGEANFETFFTKKGVNDLLIGAFADIDGHNNRTGEGWASSVTNWVWGGVCSDDAYKGSNSGDQSQINPLEGFYVDAANSYVYDHWRFYYDGVVRANDVLKALNFVTDMTDKEKKLVEAQAKFLRAHFYFELTLVHSKVPYIDENTKNPALVSNDHILWPEIETDVQYAIDNLPNNWNDKGRPTKWAAMAFMARIYLFQHKYALAKPLLEDIYLNGGFKLVPSYEMNYLIKKFSF